MMKVPKERVATIVFIVRKVLMGQLVLLLVGLLLGTPVEAGALPDVAAQHLKKKLAKKKAKLLRIEKKLFSTAKAMEYFRKVTDDELKKTNPDFEFISSTAGVVLSLDSAILSYLTGLEIGRRSKEKVKETRKAFQPLLDSIEAVGDEVARVRRLNDGLVLPEQLATKDSSLRKALYQMEAKLLSIKEKNKALMLLDVVEKDEDARMVDLAIHRLGKENSRLEDIARNQCSQGYYRTAIRVLKQLGRTTMNFFRSEKEIESSSFGTPQKNLGILIARDKEKAELLDAWREKELRSILEAAIKRWSIQQTRLKILEKNCLLPSKILAADAKATRQQLAELINEWKPRVQTEKSKDQLAQRIGRMNEAKREKFLAQQKERKAMEPANWEQVRGALTLLDKRIAEIEVAANEDTGNRDCVQP